MADLYKVMEREMLHSEHAAKCFLEAKRLDKARKKAPKCPKCGGRYSLAEEGGGDIKTHN